MQSNNDITVPYMFTVTATDPAGLSSTIDVMITVTDDMDEPPTISGTVPDFEEEAQGTPLALNAVTFTADDDDAETEGTFTWSLSGPDAGDFTIPGGVLTFRKAPNFEKPADADKDNVYVVTVVVTDPDNNRGEKSVEVRVTNADEPGEVALSALLPRVGVSLTARLTDPDGGVHNVKWQWSNGSGDNNPWRHVGHIQADRRRRKTIR